MLLDKSSTTINTKDDSTSGVRAALAQSAAPAQHWSLMIFVKYSNGKRLNGILLALGDLSIRVAIQGSDDAVEYRMVNGLWVTEDCEVVTFEFAENGFDTGTDHDVPEAIFTAEVQAPALQRIM